MFSIDLTGRKTSVQAVRVNSHGAVVLSLVAVSAEPDGPIAAELMLALPIEVVVQIFKQLRGKIPEIQVS